MTPLATGCNPAGWNAAVLEPREGLTGASLADFPARQAEGGPVRRGEKRRRSSERLLRFSDLGTLSHGFHGGQDHCHGVLESGQPGAVRVQSVLTSITTLRSL